MGKELNTILTSKQRDVLEFIERFITENKFSPTLQETMNFLKEKGGYFSAKGHIDALIKKGYLKKNPKISRGLVVTIPSIEYKQESIYSGVRNILIQQCMAKGNIDFGQSEKLVSSLIGRRTIDNILKYIDKTAMTIISANAAQMQTANKSKNTEVEKWEERWHRKQ